MLEKSATVAQVLEVKTELNETLFSQRMKFDAGIRQNKDNVERELLMFRSDIREREVKELMELQNKFHELNSSFENNRAQTRIEISAMAVQIEQVERRIVLGLFAGIISLGGLALGVARLPAGILW
jgi:hypothetical protein